MLGYKDIQTCPAFMWVLGILTQILTGTLEFQHMSLETGRDQEDRDSNWCIMCILECQLWLQNLNEAITYDFFKGVRQSCWGSDQPV